MTSPGHVTAGRAIDSTAGPINWTGGEIDGTLNDTGPLDISGSANKQLVGAINQAGTRPGRLRPPLHQQRRRLQQPGRLDLRRPRRRTIRGQQRRLAGLRQRRHLSRSPPAPAPSIYVALNNSGTMTWRVVPSASMAAAPDRLLHHGRGTNLYSPARTPLGRGRRSGAGTTHISGGTTTLDAPGGHQPRH